jgi:hypothetical protein
VYPFIAILFFLSLITLWNSKIWIPIIFAAIGLFIGAKIGKNDAQVRKLAIIGAIIGGILGVIIMIQVISNM